MDAYDLATFTIVFVTSFAAGFLTAAVVYLWQVQR